MLKRIIICFLIAFLSVSCKKKEELIIEEPSSQDREAVKTTEEAAEDEERKPLINLTTEDTAQILVRADGAPGMYLGSDGEVHGFYVDLEKMIMNEMGQKHLFVPYSDVGPAVQAFKSGVHHVALSVPDLPDYRGFMELSIHYEILNYVTFVQNNNMDIKGETKEEIIKSLHGKKVGVQTQGHIYQILREIKEIEIVEYPTTTKAMEALNQGLLDAVPDVKRIGDYYSKLNNWEIKPVGKAIISHKISTGFSQAIDPSFVDRYNVALEKIISDGRLETLWSSYFGPMTKDDKPW